MAAGFPVPEGIVIVASGQMENELKAHLPDGRLAVRSSGFSEDSQSASFAGQYATIMGLPGLTDTSPPVERDFASFATPRSQPYEASYGSEPPSVALLVQHLIDSDAPGAAS